MFCVHGLSPQSRGKEEQSFKQDEKERGFCTQTVAMRMQTEDIYLSES